MSNYYADKLNAQSLFRIYETAIPEVREYLDSEIDFVREKLTKDDYVLDMGAGYGRIVKELAPHCKTIVGMDISVESVELGREYLKDYSNAAMITMDAHHMHFNHDFNVILCLQNGLSAMSADYTVIENMVKLLAPGGTLYISSYSEKFWNWRLKWFEEQADKGLLGEIDYKNTKDGVIVCKDGFRATTHWPWQLEKIGEEIGLPYLVKEVDESSLFLIVQKPFSLKENRNERS